MNTARYVSVHGGHSGQFCNHASDSLEEIIRLYIARGFEWVGITEHTPPPHEQFLYPDEVEASLTPQELDFRFGQYMTECRRLQKKYDGDIDIYVAMEIETYSGYEPHIRGLISRYKPDYIVGSVHFVNDIGFDYSPEQYITAMEACGSIEALYCRYFDQQYDMISTLKPAVVGHFDLIRIFDSNYRAQLLTASVMQRIERNLQCIQELDLILDFNLRSLLKGADEPYVSRVILEKARDMGIAVVPGDDSHGQNSVGAMMDVGISILVDLGFTTQWQRPKLISY